MKCLLLLFSLVSIISTSVLAQKTKWHRSEYPNPTKDLGSCKRQISSLICDPNLILTQEDADAIDDILKDIRQATRCPCPNQGDCRGDMKGYLPLVLIMDEMITDAERVNRENKYDLTMGELLDEAQRFGYTQMERFNISRCGEDLVIVYSVHDHLLYTVTGKLVKMKLTNDLIGEISLNYRRYFSPTGKSSEKKMGFANLLRDYKDVLLGTYETYVKRGSQENPNYEAVRDNMAVGKTASMMVVGLTLMINVAFGRL